MQRPRTEIAWRRSALVRRLAKGLTIALLGAVPVWFAPLYLGSLGLTAYILYFTLLTLLTGVTFVGAVATRDISVGLAAGFALALLALYWFIVISHGVIHTMASIAASSLLCQPPNQAMQLTASKPAVYAWSVCRRERMLRGMHRGLAAADLVSR